MHTLHWIDFAASFDSVVVVVVEERERERERKKESVSILAERAHNKSNSFWIIHTKREREREREKEERTQHASTAGFRHLRARFFPRFRRFLPVSASHNEVVVVVVVQKKSSRPSFEKSVEYVNALFFL